MGGADVSSSPAVEGGEVPPAGVAAEPVGAEVATGAAAALAVEGGAVPPAGVAAELVEAEAAEGWAGGEAVPLDDVTAELFGAAVAVAAVDVPAFGAVNVEFGMSDLADGAAVSFAKKRTGAPAESDGKAIAARATHDHSIGQGCGWPMVNLSL
uniref:Uncharacterized protein n=1 Tax=Alexandrium monilatum TaxID=311494 RepID=A0A7S4VET8_9DINO